MRPYLRVANVYEDRIDLSSIYEMNFSPEEFESYELHSGDILLNEGQSLELVGRSAIYRNELPGACFTNTLVRFRPAQGLKAEFAQTYFRACLRNHRFRKLARWTTNIAHLGGDRFAAMEFPLPPLAEQEAIVEAVEDQLSVIDHLDADLDAKLKSAQVLRQSILRHAFTGQLVPQDRNDEPASKLLKRIAAEQEERARQVAAAKQSAKEAKPVKAKTTTPRRQTLTVS
jgi:type I restriction enzyme S subunit